MRHTRPFKHHPATFALLSVLSSLLFLLGACAERSTPTPASSGTTGPAATIAFTLAPGTTPTRGASASIVQVAASAVSTPTTGAVPTATPLPSSSPAAPTATATAPATAPATVKAAATPTATARPVPTATAKPAPPKTVAPTPGLADSKADGVGVSILAVNGARPGKGANVTIQTSPLVECAIVYAAPGGSKSAAKGLENKTSDENGRITWNWTIGTNTKPGQGKVSVTCGDSTQTAPITIG